MMRTSTSTRARLFSRSALGIALALGVAAGGTLTAAPALAQKQPKPAPVKLSPNFQKVAAPLQQALEAAKAKPDVVAAKGAVAQANQALQRAPVSGRPQARSAVDAAVAALGNTLSAEKAQLEGAFAAATTPDDRMVAGQFALNLGSLADDYALQRRGIQTMIDSGKVAPAEVPKLQFYVGQLSYQLRDFATARTALQAAVSGGYVDNDAEALLAEAYMSDNQTAQGLTVLKQAIDKKKAGGQPAPIGWYRRALGAAYNAKLLDQAGDFAIGLVQAYPSTESWGQAITIIREIGRGKFQAQESLDLVRLMGRTNSYVETRDYLEYMEYADARRLPGEVAKVIESGIASGKLSASDPTVADQRNMANGRIAADRASLPALERDSRAANATAVTTTAGGDAFLSYGDAAKAEELYTLALAKPGVDAPRALTRLGIAQTDQGKYADAQATFAKVDGVRKPIAQLWSAYAAQKAGGGAVPAAR
jgi:tetratricopeptide (TPR) repeat protein